MRTEEQQKAWKEFKPQWIKALRSGEFKQGKDKLATIDDINIVKSVLYCCLGVACVVENLPQKSLLDGSIMFGNPEDSSKHYFPKSMIDKYGFNNFNPYIKTLISGLIDQPKNKTTLAGLNDRGYTFEQIADLIEAGELDD